MEVVFVERARAGAGTESVPDAECQMWALLRLHREGRLQPARVAGVGGLPANATLAERKLRDLLVLWFGLRLADGTREPLMLATSVLVDEGIVATKGGASKLLHRFEAAGVIWSPGEMPRLGRGDGTRLFLPGRPPSNPFRPPVGGWCVEPLGDGLSDGLLSDDSPGPVFVSGAVPVESHDVVVSAVEPAMEAVDEAGVSDAVGAGSSDALDGVAATTGCTGGGMFDLVGHGWEAYDAGPTPMWPATWPVGPAVSPDVLLAWALRRVRAGSRNDVGFQLAQQAHDNDYSGGQVLMLLRRYGELVPAGDHPYTATERRKTVRSVLRMPRREPWATSVVGGP